MAFLMRPVEPPPSPRIGGGFPKARIQLAGVDQNVVDLGDDLNHGRGHPQAGIWSMNDINGPNNRMSNSNMVLLLLDLVTAWDERVFVGSCICRLLRLGVASKCIGAGAINLDAK